MDATFVVGELVGLAALVRLNEMRYRDRGGDFYLNSQDSPNGNT